MVSIAVHGGRTPHDGLHDVVDWGRVVVATAARAVIATLFGLALWSAAPALLGWHPTTVMTGSMEPRLEPGDVVVSRPVTPVEIRLGQILLADDPDRAGHLRMHRFVDPGRDGTIVTKGDANPQADSTPIERSAVLGVASLRIPFVATPVLWVREGRWVETAMLALAVAAVLALCTVDGGLRRPAARHRGDRDGDGDGNGDGDLDDDDDDDGAGSDGREARGAPVSTVAGSASAERRHVRHRRSATGIATILVLATGAGALLPSPAQAAPWPARTTTSASWTAAVVPQSTITSCTGGSTATVTWSYPGSTNPPEGFTVYAGTKQVATATPSQRSATIAASNLELLSSYDVTVRAVDGTWYSTSAPRRVNVVVGLGTTAIITCS